MADTDSTVIDSKTQLANLRGAEGQCAAALQAIGSVIRDYEKLAARPPAEEGEVTVRRLDDGEVRAFFIPTMALQELSSVDGLGMHNIGEELNNVFWDIHTFSYLLGLVGEEQQVSRAVVSSIASRVEDTMTKLLRIANVIGSWNPVDVPAN